MAGRQTPKGPLTVDRLKAMLHYDPETGHFTRLRMASHHKPGDRAGWVCNGYIMIGVDGRNYRAHRLAWLYTHGTWPTLHLDHINGIPTDNRIANLREVTDGQNHQNIATARRHSRTGVLGVQHYRDRYRASIQVDGRTRHLGIFDTTEEAHAAYLAAKRKFHPFSARIA